jgi:predicted phage-related endonuclease
MITLYKDLEQGSPEWLAARCGLITASETKLIITPTLKIADNEKVKLHLYELCAQRVTKYVEPSYVSENMMRGNFDEMEARIIYNDKIAAVEEMGFITNDKFGYAIGYSPDGLVGEDGLIEVKSRVQKYQMQTVANDQIPSDYMIQLQTGLLVSERKWIDFIQYSGGMVMYVKRCYPDPKIQQAIIEATAEFEKKAAEIIEKYTTNADNFIMTERKIYEDITL